jgi:hypothetical protein
LRCLCVLLLPALDAAAQTAEVPERPERGDLRELRRDALLEAQEFADRFRPVGYKLLLGLAYTDAQSGEERWATPFQFRVRFNEHKTYFKVSGDGYVDSRSEAEGELSGIANLNLWLGRSFAEGWRGALGVTVPTGGEVGSERGRERASLSYERELWRSWSAMIQAQLVYFNAAPEEGDSRVRRQLLGQLAYAFDPLTLAFAQLERAYRPGVSAATVASAGYQMPIGRTAGGAVLGIASFAHGLTAGVRDNTLEIDVCWRF